MVLIYNNHTPTLRNTTNIKQKLNIIFQYFSPNLYITHVKYVKLVVTFIEIPTQTKFDTILALENKK